MFCLQKIKHTGNFAQQKSDYTLHAYHNS